MRPMHITGVFGTVIIHKVNDGPKFKGVHAPSMIAGVFIYPRGEAVNDATFADPPPARA